tara:strand:+ start:159 stop:896 length:738 start_codon:yes stop_codon:yes gene_type:complete
MIKSQETWYNNWKYRSKLEALWASFFTHLGVDFDYEPQRYQLESDSYLPDFLLKNVSFVETKWEFFDHQDKLWFEVKNPEKCTFIDKDQKRKFRLDHSRNDVKKVKELALITGIPSTIIWFTPESMYTTYVGTKIWFNDSTIFAPSYRPEEPKSHKSGHIILGDSDYREWSARFYKCPECEAISFARDHLVYEYGMKHKEGCSIPKEEKSYEPRSYGFNYSMFPSKKKKRSYSPYKTARGFGRSY